MSSSLPRYSCQIALPEFGKRGQELLRQARVLIAGVGGLGCPAAQYIAASGIGTIGIADYDTISHGNLHRQILYTPEEVGLKKTTVACTKLQLQNPDVTLIPHDIQIGSDNVFELISQYDIVVDGTDNFETRYLLNDACCLAGKPLVYGAIYQYEGQVTLFNLRNADETRGPNLRDLFPEVDASQIPNCAEGGVLPTVAGMIGCMQANEVIKYLTGIGDLLSGKLLILDALTLQSRIVKIGTVTKTVVQQLQPTVAVPLISPADLKKGLSKDLYELIDVRSISERESYNIGGTHIPHGDIGNSLPYLKTDKPIILYCATGKRSAEAITAIRKQNPSAMLFSLGGGIKAWKEFLDQSS